MYFSPKRCLSEIERQRDKERGGLRERGKEGKGEGKGEGERALAHKRLSVGNPEFGQQAEEAQSRF